MKNIYNLNDLSVALAERYQHLFAEKNLKAYSPHEIIQHIVRYYEDIINSMPGNVYWLDKHCVAVGCNKNVLKMFGLESVADFKGLTFKDMAKIGHWSEEARTYFENHTLEVIKSGKPILGIHEPAIHHRDGTTLNFLTSRVPLFDNKNELIGVVGISVDVSELKKAQAELQEEKNKAEAANQAKSEFIANMSHDIKTPLSGIIGLSELLTYHLQAPNLELAEMLHSSSKQLLTFFENCLELFKLETGNFVVLSVPFNLKSLIEEVATLFKPILKTKELAFFIDYPEELPSQFLGGRIGIYKILLNLISNAIKFTAQGTIQITIRTEALNSTQVTLQLSIKDTGIGIPEDNQHIIFDCFTRLVPSYKGTYEGSGIGLYIVKKLVTELKGHVTIQSKEGEGSEFIVTMPLTISQASHSEKSEQLSPAISDNLIEATSWDHLNVLLVEDNYAVQLIQKALLASLNCHVDVAESGEHALELFEPGKYDLILMDIGLPGIQGDKTAKLIRKIEHHTEFPTPIIALTAHSIHEEEAIIPEGMQSILSKPLSLEKTKHLLQKYCSKK